MIHGLSLYRVTDIAVRLLLLLRLISLCSTHSLASSAQFSKHESEQEADETNQVVDHQPQSDQLLHSPPVSFLPVCKPTLVHAFSKQQIRCACGVNCRFLCRPKHSSTEKEKTESGPKVCRRVCTPKWCFRPQEYHTYHYRLMGGLCRRWKECAYQGKCEGTKERRIHYHPLGCQKVNPYNTYDNHWENNDW